MEIARGERESDQVEGGLLEAGAKFDEYKIVEHYVHMREIQQQRLANINLSEQLKRKLFSFSEGYYLTNPHDPYRLLIENHPLRGRTIMTEERHRIQMHNRLKERGLGHSHPSSQAKNFSEEGGQMDSDLDLPLQGSTGTPNPQFSSDGRSVLRESGNGKETPLNE